MELGGTTHPTAFSTPAGPLQVRQNNHNYDDAVVPFGQIPDALVQRYRNLVRPERVAGHWHHQPNYPGPFWPGKHALDLDDVRAVLEQRRHVAVRARDDGMTEHLAFDLDCRSDADLSRRDTLYWSIRRVMGQERQPLVYRTPSGRGLRVVYRIPEMQLERIVTGRRAGLVAEVLRAADLPVRDGELEIFPQKRQVDRLPLGCNMPLLDPETLEPIPKAAIGAVPDPTALDGALSVMEAWSAAPHTDLVPHLESLLGQPVGWATRTGSATARAAFPRVGRTVKPSDATRRLVSGGLQVPSSRYESEWRVGLAIVLAPELFECFGARDAMGDAAIAHTLARWLAERNNGYSSEWDASLRVQGSVQQAINAWTDRYLAPSGVSGDNMIVRLRRAAAALDGSLRRTHLLCDNERQAVMRLAEEAGLRGSRLYRAEVWLAASRRAVKRIIKHHTRMGAPPDEREENGQRLVVVQIAARWMQGWSYGKGASTRTGVGACPAYVRYRRMLMDAGWMSLERYSPTAEAFRGGMRPPDDLAFEASTYAVRVPDLDVRVRDAGVDALELRALLEESPIAMSGRPLGLDEAHHILWLTRRAVPVRKRYGYRLGVRLESIARELERRLPRRMG